MTFTVALVLIIDPDQLITTTNISQHTTSYAVRHAYNEAMRLGLNVQVIP